MAFTPHTPYFSDNRGRDESNFLRITNTVVIYQLVCLTIDIICNLVVDSTSFDPMVGLILFLIQALTILVNLISIIMLSSHEAIQRVFTSSKTHFHSMNTVTILSYLTLTIGWYIWSLRRSWPAAGNQFSYSFLPRTNFTVNESDSLPFGSGFDNLKEHRQFYMLWSPGFMALYTCQRTVAFMYYGINLMFIFLLVNTRQLSSSSATHHHDTEHKEKRQMRMTSAFVYTGNSRSQRTNSGKELQERLSA